MRSNQQINKEPATVIESSPTHIRENLSDQRRHELSHADYVLRNGIRICRQEEADAGEGKWRWNPHFVQHFPS